jgi:hypothetical protein
MRGASDEDHLALALREERTIFSQDADHRTAGVR